MTGRKQKQKATRNESRRTLAHDIERHVCAALQALGHN